MSHSSGSVCQSCGPRRVHSVRSTAAAPLRAVAAAAAAGEAAAAAAADSDAAAAVAAAALPCRSSLCMLCCLLRPLGAREGGAGEDVVPADRWEDMRSSSRPSREELEEPAGSGVETPAYHAC